MVRGPGLRVDPFEGSLYPFTAESLIRRFR